MSRRRRLSANPRHVTAAIIVGGCRWQGSCSCGWVSRRNLRWQISAWDAAAGHLLDAERAEVAS